jgi:glycosyltransferase involved in cell wall biosynthesis
MNVHDVTTFTHPELSSPRAVRWQRKQLKAARECAVVIALSEAAAEEIARVGDIPRDRIVVGSVGVRLTNGASRTKPIPGSYVLAVGEVSLRKGFDVIAQALASVPKAPPLVIAGPDGWGAQEVRQRIESVRRGDVIYLGHVNDDDLHALYRNSTVVCHASYAEGFGLPCLEAMGCGAAIVATDIPPVREMADGCVMFVPPGDAEAMASAIRSLLRDSDKRSEMGRRARERASAYSWEAVADRVVGAYVHAMQ